MLRSRSGGRTTPFVPVRSSCAVCPSLCRLSVPPPPQEWLQTHHLSLVAALIPESVLLHHPLPAAEARPFLSRLHQCLAERLAECLRRRGELRAGTLAAQPPHQEGPNPSGPGTDGRGWVSGQRRPCLLSAERRLSVAELRQAEISRRVVPPAPSSPLLGQVPDVPLTGPRRQEWLRERLLQIVQEETQVCPPAFASSALVLLALFERSTGDQLQAYPGVLVWHAEWLPWARPWAIWPWEVPRLH